MDNNRFQKTKAEEIKDKLKRNEISFDKLNTSDLYDLLDYETDLIAEGREDMELIRKCTEFLDKTKGEEPISEKEILDIFRDTEGQIEIIPKQTPVIFQRKRIFKRIAIFVAAVLLAVSCFVVLYKPFQGFQRETENETYSNETKDNYMAPPQSTFDSLEELCNRSDLDILCPSALPNGFDIEKIELVHPNQTGKTLNILTKDHNLGIIIAMDVDKNWGNQFLSCEPSSDEWFGDCIQSESPQEDDSSEMTNEDSCVKIPSEYTADGITFKIQYNTLKKIFFAFTVFEGDGYYISAYTYEDLIFIINNLTKN